MHTDIVGLADGEITQNQAMGVAAGGIRSSPGIVSCIISGRISSTARTVSRLIVTGFEYCVFVEHVDVLFMGWIQFIVCM